MNRSIHLEQDLPHQKADCQFGDWQASLGLAAYCQNNIFSGCINGRDIKATTGDILEVSSPIDGQPLASFRQATAENVDETITKAEQGFLEWRKIPAPKRGEVIRKASLLVREKKECLAYLITIEAGKTTQEALGEVQEWIDICEFALGLSRQLYGLTISTERPNHRMMEQWLPLGPVGVITAFNFPMAVWAWNAMIGLVCGNPIIWKPSEKTPLCALACQKIMVDALRMTPSINDDIAQNLCHVVVGGKEIGQRLAQSKSLPLISATGSVPMGREVAKTVIARLGRHLLELGGNNGMIVTPSANLDLAIRSIVFSAVGTSGQRCTSLRRLIVHESIIDDVIRRVSNAFSQIEVGDPRDSKVVMGPLIDENAWRAMEHALNLAQDHGGTLIIAAERVTENLPAGVYVKPALLRIPWDAAIIKEETFAPILYVSSYSTLSEAIEINNSVPQGLSSAIFTESIKEAEYFLSACGSDCGIANVNIGTSGAEIGGAFGGEKDTGGGRESGSDSWKNYMRRVTNTINYGEDLPLAQGIKFD